MLLWLDLKLKFSTYFKNYGGAAAGLGQLEV